MKVRMTFVAFLVAGLAAAGCVPAAARERPMAKQEAVAASLAPSLVRVEYTLRTDKGEAPSSSDRYFREDRAGESVGYLVAPTTVVLLDRTDFPRFVDTITVRLGEESVKASFSAWAAEHQAVFLELEQPLKGGVPLVFDATKGPPYLSASCGEWSGNWAMQVQAYSPPLLVTEGGRRVCAAPPNALMTDAAGVPVGLSLDGDLPSDDSWKGSPMDWKRYSTAERDKQLDALRLKAEQGVVRVSLHFRSPTEIAGITRPGPNTLEAVIDLDVPGVLLEGGRVLALANLPPKVTARLERITVHGKTLSVPATFVGSLADYGCLVATVDRPLPGEVALSGKSPFDYENQLLGAIDLRFHGENRAANLSQRRIVSYKFGWQKHIFPQVYGTETSLFLFDNEGALVAFPIAHRERVSMTGTYPAYQPEMTFASYLRDTFQNLTAHIDTRNIPLKDLDEHRLAWLGVELQPLSRNLARENRVSEYTQDGKTGAIISYVYPNSPAAKAGLKTGNILLRVRPEGEPRPMEVAVALDREYLFKWETMDNMPESMYENLATPWPSTENTFTRALTDFGFGRKYTAEFFFNGRFFEKEFTVEPVICYDAAARYKSQVLGITVRDLTYEVRRYLQKADTDLGVVISKEEPGSKASVAGIKPFEVITHVNDKEIRNVRDFEAAVSVSKGDIRMTVNRLSANRVVKILMAGGAAPESDEPAEPKKPAADEKPPAQKPAAEKPAVEPRTDAE
jgi:serine protease Do